jgi:hypothetical protein
LVEALQNQNLFPSMFQKSANKIRSKFQPIKFFPMDDVALSFLEGTSLEASLDNYHQFRPIKKIVIKTEFQKWAIFRYLKKTKRLEACYLPRVLKELEGDLNNLTIAAWRALECYIRADMLTPLQRRRVKNIAYKLMAYVCRGSWLNYIGVDYCALTDTTASLYALFKLHLSYSLILLDYPYSDPEYYIFWEEHAHIFIKALLKLKNKEINSRFVVDYVYDGVDKNDQLTMGFLRHIHKEQLCDEKSQEIISTFLSIN